MEVGWLKCHQVLVIREGMDRTCKRKIPPMKSLSCVNSNLIEIYKSFIFFHKGALKSMLQFSHFPIVTGTFSPYPSLHAFPVFSNICFSKRSWRTVVLPAHISGPARLIWLGFALFKWMIAACAMNIMDNLKARQIKIPDLFVTPGQNS